MSQRSMYDEGDVFRSDFEWVDGVTIGYVSMFKFVVYVVRDAKQLLFMCCKPSVVNSTEDQKILHIFG